MNKRRTPEERKAAALQKIAALKMKVARIEKAETEHARRARTRRLIVSGAIVEDLLPKFRDTAFATAFVAAVREHTKAHPEDRDSFVELLDKLTAACPELVEGPADQREAAE